jgi:hypothetical protein
MERKYTLQQLDLLVTTVLNPAKTNISDLKSDQLNVITTKLVDEMNENKLHLAKQAFGLFNKRKIRRLVKHYHNSLVQLLERAFDHYRQLEATEITKSLYKTTIDSITELLDFIEHYFGEYIDLDDWVPSPHLHVAKSDISTRFRLMEPWLIQLGQDSTLFDIISYEVNALAASSSRRHATFREVLYKKELVKQLEILFAAKPNLIHKEPVLDLLIVMNFNSSQFISYYTNLIKNELDYQDSICTKMERLLKQQKELSQRRMQEGMVLYPSSKDLKKVLARWLNAEIEYLQKQQQWVSTSARQARMPAAAKSAESFKILCFLSIDQIALFFRALDTLHIIEAKSLNAIFRNIVPYIATANRENISSESMRSKAYQFEESDKKELIRVLEAVIRWISNHQVK